MGRRGYSSSTQGDADREEGGDNNLHLPDSKVGPAQTHTDTVDIL